ncbi:methyl-accepting chemotaxis protein [Epibacterium sp. MM17-32]|uniref:methyl-accepting chemotaxis protein n=1 Tax=Epibacterium sp. MM17-32 TaxID=2917734 RepID=UPI001EF751F7|nr:methyl-accepting chemotaxis protein [Epibacterium sp. MM17-32]MCG7628474.1 methyl-accepting chemotaxis protein [Epibacterium sp. MM17-32]
MIDKTQATIRFQSDGTIIEANENFLSTVGYSLDEIVGRHHSMFVDEEYARSEEYSNFWTQLAAGESFTDQFPRVTKHGDIVWIQATYAPLHDHEGNVIGVMKIASDITERQTGVAEIAKALEDLSNGNLELTFQKSNLPDLRLIGDNLEKASQRLRASISMVQEISSAIERTSREICEASSDLSKRTETQAATLEQTAAAMEELTATVRQSAEGASEVEASTVEAKKTAENGGAVVAKGVEAMARIESSSQQITNIISVIDDIAFQTNLLALNAGVEAARAGEAGRGFAVVASEVRGLAQRSSEAAGEIKALITESSSHVKAGVELVGNAGEELEKIINVVATIADNIADIARGASEQSITLGEINTGVAQMDSVTQHNAAMVEETTAAGQTLASDADKLASSISSFRVGKVSTASASNDRPGTETRFAS